VVRIQASLTCSASARPQTPAVNATRPAATRRVSGERQRPRPAPVVGAGQLRPGGVPRLIVEHHERLLGGLFRQPPGAGLVGKDADHLVAGLVAVQHGGTASLPVEGDVVPDRDRDSRRPWLRRPARQGGRAADVAERAAVRRFPASRRPVRAGAAPGGGARFRAAARRCLVLRVCELEAVGTAAGRVVDQQARRRPGRGSRRACPARSRPARCAPPSEVPGRRFRSCRGCR
jgi:hypothetical protein